jgi:hypothetical protein
MAGATGLRERSQERGLGFPVQSGLKSPMSMHILKPQHFAKLEDDLAACYCLVAHYRMSDLTNSRNC